MEKFTGVRFDAESGEFEAVVCGEVEGWGNTAREAAAKLQECVLWRATVASKTQAPAILQIVPNAPQHAEKRPATTMARTPVNTAQIQAQRAALPVL